jgi:glycolate oxidase iron-sulfur subunit
MNKDDLEKGLMACVHCGFCLQACPTYRETGDESDSPRGRIVLMRRVNEGSLPMASGKISQTGDAAYHLDRCLGCRACETACPSGVPYGSLLEHFRDRQEKEVARPVGERALRGGLLATLTSPTRMAIAARAGKLTGGKVPGPVAKFLGLPSDTQMPLPDDLRAAGRPLPEVTPAQGTKRGRVALLNGCVMRVLFGPVHHATARVLSANGVEVVCPPIQGCCGALHGHQGELDEAMQMARDTITAFERDPAGYDAIVVNSAGCGSFLKEYGILLKDDPAWAERAAAFSAKVKDVCEYLHALGARPMTTPLNVRVTYHDACHLAHGQKITSAPRALLKAIPGATFVELADSDLCCGSAGVYNFLHPDMARSLQHKKVANVLATGADVVATGNPGCLSWIKTGLPEGVTTPEVVHPIELLDRAYRASPVSTLR